MAKKINDSTPEPPSTDGEAVFHGQKPRTTGFTYYLGFMAVIGGFLFGYDTGVVSSAMLFVPEAMKLNYVWTELIVSVTVGACAIFSLVAGVCNDWLGRRKTILLASFFFTVGAVLLAASLDKYMLLVGRIIIGAAVGLASMTVPVYLAEVCPTHLRGTMVTGFQLMITFGLFVASVLGGAFSLIDPYRVGWRLMMGAAGVPSLIQFIGFIFLPESPRWLANRNRDEEAKKVLRKVYAEAKYLEYEMSEIRENRMILRAELEQLGGGWVFFHMLKTPHVRKALILGCALQAFQQLAGINTLMYYTATIINMSGVRDPTNAIWMSCAVTGVNVLCTFIPIVLVERLGRRPLWLCSLLGAAPMPWVINSEIYPYWARSTGIALATFFNWAMNLIISQTFLTLTEAITKYGAFFLYMGITCFAFVLFFFVLPETKGTRIEQVEEIFGKKPKNRTVSPANGVSEQQNGK